MVKPATVNAVVPMNSLRLIVFLVFGFIEMVFIWLFGKGLISCYEKLLFSGGISSDIAYYF